MAGMPHRKAAGTQDSNLRPSAHMRAKSQADGPEYQRTKGARAIGVTDAEVLRVLSLRPQDHPRFSTFRVDAFTDAVYAIAATILVLELRPPKVDDGNLGTTLLDLRPHYFAYALGFVQIIGG